MKAYFQLLRPEQWIKNVFVLIPLIFSRQFFDSETLLLALQVFGIFCIASSSIYVLNDLIDAPADRLHPEKKIRPIASRKVSLASGFFLWIVLGLLSLLLSFLLSFPLFIILLGYLLMTMAYSLYLKQVLFLDVILVALGYVFRVLGGGIVIGVIVSEWMIVLVFLFTLFITISKRRQELKNLAKLSRKTRSVLTRYTIELIDQINAILVPIVITSYIIYTFSERENNPYFIASIPVILYAFFRFLYLLKNTGFLKRNEDLLKDLPLDITVLLWLILALAGLS